MGNMGRIATVVIQDEVARSFRLSRDQLLSRKRRRDYCYPRMLAMYLVRELTRQSFPAIALQFGGVHHTSVMYACRWAGDNGDYKAYIDTMMKRLGGRDAVQQ